MTGQLNVICCSIASRLYRGLTRQDGTDSCILHAVLVHSVGFCVVLFVGFTGSVSSSLFQGRLSLAIGNARQEQTLHDFCLVYDLDSALPRVLLSTLEEICRGINNTIVGDFEAMGARRSGCRIIVTLINLIGAPA